VKRARSLPVLLSVAGLLAAGSVSAQFVHLSRCRAAVPCSFAFGLQYAPDPLIAGPYAQAPSTAVSGRVELTTPIKVELDRPIDQKAIDEAVRKSLELHPPGNPAPALPASAVAPPAILEPKPAPEKD